MKLRELYLYPDLVDYEDEIVHPFRDQSRSICNYLERKLQLIKFETLGFRRICVIGKKEPEPECHVNSSKVLIVEIPFDRNRYESLELDRLNPFFSQMLVEGVQKCQASYLIPGNELLEGLKEFSESGGVNRWLLGKKTFKEIGIMCALHCELTVEAFQLSLVLNRGMDVIYDRMVLKTAPDEIVYMPMIQGLNLVGECIVITDKFGDTTFSMSVKELNR